MAKEQEPKNDPKQSDSVVAAMIEDLCPSPAVADNEIIRPGPKSLKSALGVIPLILAER
jgi:hypothetical protein